MDQIKIGKFIQEKRKEQRLTQSDLAEKLNITDRAVSKWENGNCLPDVSIMHDLCAILKITINDLFSGEIIDMKDNEKKLEEHLLEITKLKEKKDKQLLRLEIIIGLIVTISFLTLVFVSSFIEMDARIRILLILIGFIIFVIGVGYAIGIEQTAGYYECQKCHYKYIPTYQSVLWAMHINRTRYMKCPKCNKKSWQKKIINKE